jgi:hypothetical protein
VDVASFGADRRRGSAFQANNNLDINTVYTLLQGNSTAPGTTIKARAIITSMTGDPGSGGLPQTRLGVSDEVILSETLVPTWQPFEFSTPVPKTNNT